MKIIGNSTAIQTLRKQIQKVAETNAAVLLQGESGTGKELVAMAIHEQSPRNTKEFVYACMYSCQYPENILITTCEAKREINRMFLHI